jgi:hypothetical protein
MRVRNAQRQPHLLKEIQTDKLTAHFTHSTGTINPGYYNKRLKTDILPCIDAPGIFLRDGESQNWSYDAASVADPGCLSRIPKPDFFPIPDHGSRIPDPKTTTTKERGEKKLVVKPFFVATNFKKIDNYFIF